MEKVRFTCPFCSTVMQTTADRIGSEVACPECGYQFRLVENEKPQSSGSGIAAEAPTLPPGSTANSEAQNTVPVSKPYGNHPSPSGPYGQSQPAPVVNINQANPYHTPVAPAVGQARFSCPYCDSRRPPIWKSEVSQLGWIVFVILLMTTCFLCFIGLFIRDQYRVCADCKARLD